MIMQVFHRLRLRLSIIFILIFLGCSLKASPVAVGSGRSLDDEEEMDLKPQAIAEPSRSVFSNLWTDHRFTYRHEFSYNVEEPQHVVTNRSSLRLEWNRFFADRYYLTLDGKLIVFASNDHQSRAEDEFYLVEGRLREGYVQLNLGRTSLKIGRQIIVWGEMEGAIITDVMSPRDTSEFLFGSLEDARLGQTSLLVDQYSNMGTWSFIVTPVPRTDRMAKPGTEYSMDIKETMILAVDDPTSDSFPFLEVGDPTWGDMEYGLRWKHTWGKIDLAFMLARLVGNQAVYKYQGETTQGQVRMLEQFGRFSMLGSAGSFAKGGFLWKGELAYKLYRTGEAFNDMSSPNRRPQLEHDTIDAALGMEYSPTGNYTLGLETSHQHILAVGSGFASTSALVLHWTRRFLRETLEFQLMSSYQFQSRLSIVQVRSSYHFTDQLTGYFEAAYLGTWSEDRLLDAFRRKSRITVKIEYQF